MALCVRKVLETFLIMDKPTVFLSHSSKDGEALQRLKSLLEAKTNGTIEFFLSSDGESIPFGKNWVATIEQALGRAKIMFVFLSPHSIGSGWIHFESGFSYSKGINVVPVAMPGLDLRNIPAPLSLLQGFNIHSHEALTNLLVVINKTFINTHNSLFSEKEFHEVFADSKRHEISSLGLAPELFQRITFTTDGDASSILKIKNVLEEKGLECKTVPDGKWLSTYGAHLKVLGESVSIEVSSYAANLVFGVLDAALTVDNDLDINVTIYFSDYLATDTFIWDSTAKIYGSEIRLSSNGYDYKGAQFHFKMYRDNPHTNPLTAAPPRKAILGWKHRGKFADKRLPEALALLYRLGILYDISFD
jgi:hypothetical protein